MASCRNGGPGLPAAAGDGWSPARVVRGGSHGCDAQAAARPCRAGCLGRGQRRARRAPGVYTAGPARCPGAERPGFGFPLGLTGGDDGHADVAAMTAQDPKAAGWRAMPEFPLRPVRPASPCAMLTLPAPGEDRRPGSLLPGRPKQRSFHPQAPGQRSALPSLIPISGRAGLRQGPVLPLASGRQ
jgi:hypothetical protein